MKRSLMLLLAAAVVLMACVDNATRAAERPNVIFLMADDLGYGDLGCYNADSQVPTPNFDRLAEQGMRFTDAHTPSAVCTPTRYGVLTGRYCWRTRLKSGVLWGYSPALIDPERRTVASLMKQHGYHTACVGKWHLGLGAAEKTDYFKPLSPSPNTHGFDYFFGIPASLDMQPYVYVENDHAVVTPTETVAGSKQRRAGGEGFWRGGPIAPGFKHIDVLPDITRKAVEYLQERAQAPDRPFFLYFPLTAPHTPWLPTPEFAGRSKAGPYGDFAAQVDDTVGQITKALDELKLADNTLLIVTSDNGAHWTPGDKEKYPHRANGPLRGQKADIWEGGHRVPYLVRWPGHVQPGTTCDRTICHTDLFATLADLVGTKMAENEGEDSFSVLPALAGEDSTPRPPVVHHSVRGMFAIRRGPWKLILGRGSGGFSKPATIKPKPGGPVGQLYHLEHDPAEEHNLYLEQPEVVQRLTAVLQKYRESGRSRP